MALFWGWKGPYLAERAQSSSLWATPSGSGSGFPSQGSTIPTAPCPCPLPRRHWFLPGLPAIPAPAPPAYNPATPSSGRTPSSPHGTALRRHSHPYCRPRSGCEPSSPRPSRGPAVARVPRAPAPSPRPTTEVVTTSFYIL